MSTQNAGPGSASIGVGPSNDSHAGSHQASGGSGGSQLTRGLDDTGSGKPSKRVDVQDDPAQAEPEGAGSALTAATRGPQDTRSHQAGAAATGLGAPETGANQQPGDLAPGKQK